MQVLLPGLENIGDHRNAWARERDPLEIGSSLRSTHPLPTGFPQQGLLKLQRNNPSLFVKTSDENSGRILRLIRPRCLLTYAPNHSPHARHHLRARAITERPHEGLSFTAGHVHVHRRSPKPSSDGCQKRSLLKCEKGAPRYSSQCSLLRLVCEI